LAVGEFEQGAAERLLRALSEYLIEAAAAGKKMKHIIEDEEGFGQRIDDRQRKLLRFGQIVVLIHRFRSIARELRTTLGHRRACDADDPRILHHGRPSS
jgi:hypothetical protein